MKKFISVLLIFLFATSPILTQEKESPSSLSKETIGFIAGGSFALLSIVVIIAVLVKKGIIRFDPRIDVREFTLTGKGVEFADERFEFPSLTGLISASDLEGSFNELLKSVNKRAKFLEIYNHFADYAGLNSITDDQFKRLLSLHKEQIISAFRAGDLFNFKQEPESGSIQDTVESLDVLLSDVEAGLNNPSRVLTPSEHVEPYIAHPVEVHPSEPYIAYPETEPKVFVE